MFRGRQIAIVTIRKFNGESVLEWGALLDLQTNFHKHLAGDGGDSQVPNPESLENERDFLGIC